MQRISLLTLFVAMAMAVAMAADKTIMEGQIEVKIMETGGGMKLTAKAETDKDDDKDSGESDDNVTTAEPEAEATTAAPEEDSQSRKRRAAEEDSKDNVVEIMLNSLKEVDKDGNEVGTTKTDIENVASFDAVKFKIEVANEDSTIPNSKNSEDEGIKAVEITYHASVGTGDGKVQINVYIAKEAGNITLGDDAEKTMVEKGQIKFTVHIEKWVWCTESGTPNCVNGETNEVGASLDLAITVKGEGKATLNDAVDGMAPSYDIGNKNMLYVSNMIKKTDGDSTSWEKMADDYPMAVPKDDGTTMMTMRFPMFDTSIWYDPSVRLAIPGGEGVSSSSMITASLAVVMLTLLAAFIRL